MSKRVSNKKGAQRKPPARSKLCKQGPLKRLAYYVDGTVPGYNKPEPVFTSSEASQSDLELDALKVYVDQAIA